MKKENPDRDKRIQDEILVDCYNEFEVRGAWECYLDEKISFPFHAKVKVKNKQGNENMIDVIVSKFDEKSNFRVMVSETNHDFLFSVRLYELKEVKADFDTRQGINDWKYWKSK